MIICRASPFISMLHLYKLSPLSSSSSSSSSAHKLISQLRPSFSYFISNSPPTSSLYFTRKPNRNFSTAVAINEKKSETDTFFADDAVSWTSLGLSDRISNSLSNAGFRKPSLIQAGCVPAILSGKDVVVAAETGSGKTLTYLMGIPHSTSVTPLSPLGEASSRKDLTAIHEILEKVGYKDDERSGN